MLRQKSSKKPFNYKQGISEKKRWLAEINSRTATKEEDYEPVSS